MNRRAWALGLVLLVAPSTGAEVPRQDVLCAAYLSRVDLAGTRADAGEIADQLSVPRARAKVIARENHRSASAWARFKHIFSVSDDVTSRDVAFREDDFASLRSALHRRDVARHIGEGLAAMVADARDTPDPAVPLKHVLRGREEIVRFLSAVRGRAHALQGALDQHVTAKLEVIRRREEQIRSDARNIPDWRARDTLTDRARWRVFAGYGVFAVGASLLGAHFAPGVWPWLAAGLGGGWWVGRDFLFTAYQRLNSKTRAFVALRRLSKRRATLLTREARVVRADLELEALAEMIELVERPSPRPTSFAFYSHSVELPIPLAVAYHDDQPLAATVLIDAIVNGHVAFIGGRQMQLSHSLHFADGAVDAGYARGRAPATGHHRRVPARQSVLKLVDRGSRKLKVTMVIHHDFQKSKTHAVAPARALPFDIEDMLRRLEDAADALPPPLHTDLYQQGYRTIFQHLAISLISARTVDLVTKAVAAALFRWAPDATAVHRLSVVQITSLLTPAAFARHQGRTPEGDRPRGG